MPPSPTASHAVAEKTELEQICGTSCVWELNRMSAAYVDTLATWELCTSPVEFQLDHLLLSTERHACFHECPHLRRPHLARPLHFARAYKVKATLRRGTHNEGSCYGVPIVSRLLQLHGFCTREHRKNGSKNVDIERSPRPRRGTVVAESQANKRQQCETTSGSISHGAKVSQATKTAPEVDLMAGSNYKKVIKRSQSESRINLSLRTQSSIDGNANSVDQHLRTMVIKRQLCCSVRARTKSEGDIVPVLSLNSPLLPKARQCRLSENSSEVADITGAWDCREREEGEERECRAGNRIAGFPQTLALLDCGKERFVFPAAIANLSPTSFIEVKVMLVRDTPLCGCDDSCLRADIERQSNAARKYRAVRVESYNSISSSVEDFEVVSSFKPGSGSLEHTSGSDSSPLTSNDEGSDDSNHSSFKRVKRYQGETTNSRQFNRGRSVAAVATLQFPLFNQSGVFNQGRYLLPIVFSGTVNCPCRKSRLLRSRGSPCQACFALKNSIRCSSSKYRVKTQHQTRPNRPHQTALDIRFKGQSIRKDRICSFVDSGLAKNSTIPLNARVRKPCNSCHRTSPCRTSSSSGSSSSSSSEQPYPDSKSWETQSDTSSESAGCSDGIRSGPQSLSSTTSIEKDYVLVNEFVRVSSTSHPSSSPEKSRDIGKFEVDQFCSEHLPANVLNSLKAATRAFKLLDLEIPSAGRGFHSRLRKELLRHTAYVSRRSNLDFLVLSLPVFPCPLLYAPPPLRNYPTGPPLPRVWAPHEHLPSAEIDPVSVISRAAAEDNCCDKLRQDTTHAAVQWWCETAGAPLAISPTAKWHAWNEALLKSRGQMAGEGDIGKTKILSAPTPYFADLVQEGGAWHPSVIGAAALPAAALIPAVFTRPESTPALSSRGIQPAGHIDSLGNNEDRYKRSQSQKLAPEPFSKAVFNPEDPISVAASVTQMRPFWQRMRPYGNAQRMPPNQSGATMLEELWCVQHKRAARSRLERERRGLGKETSEPSTPTFYSPSVQEDWRSQMKLLFLLHATNHYPSALSPSAPGASLIGIAASVNWADEDQIKFFEEQLRTLPPLSMQLILELLSPLCHNSVLRKFAYKALEQSTETEITRFLPQLVQVIRWESSTGTCNQLLEALLDRSVKSARIASAFHWCLQCESEDSDQGYVFVRINQQLMEALGQAASREPFTTISRQRKLVLALRSIDSKIQARNDRAEGRTDYLRELLKKSAVMSETGGVAEAVSPVKIVNGLSNGTGTCPEKSGSTGLSIQDDAKLNSSGPNPCITSADHQQANITPPRTVPRTSLDRGQTGPQVRASSQQHRGMNLINITPPIPLPIEPNGLLIGIDPMKSYVLKSSQYPLLLACKLLVPQENDTPVQEGSAPKESAPVYQMVVKSYMYKSGDDLRQDQLVAQVMRMTDEFLRSYGCNYRLTLYDAVPLSRRDGFVEFIADATPLSAIRRNYGGSVRRFLAECNPTASPQKLATIHDTFIRSCAASCVITFLLGVGDRHLDNLMVRPNGSLFHVDFGYIFGDDPRPFPPPQIRLGTEMIDALGGLGTQGYTAFQLLCCQSFRCIRRHADFLLTLLLPMISSGIQSLARRRTTAALGDTNSSGINADSFGQGSTIRAGITSNSGGDLQSSLSSLSSGIPTAFEPSRYRGKLYDFLCTPPVSPSNAIRSERAIATVRAIPPAVQVFLLENEALRRVRDKFQLDLAEIEAERYLLEVISQSASSVFPAVVDRFHEWSLYWR